MDSDLIVLTWLLAGPLIGVAIGRTKDRAGFGAVLGLILGPIGWLILLAFPSNRPKCPYCLGAVPQGAVKCLHCGSELSAVALATPEEDRSYGLLCPHCQGIMRFSPRSRSDWDSEFSCGACNMAIVPSQCSRAQSPPISHPEKTASEP